jgi:hypothetical protein
MILINHYEDIHSNAWKDDIIRQLLAVNLIEENKNDFQFFFEKGYQDFQKGCLIRFKKIDMDNKIIHEKEDEKIKDTLYIEKFCGKIYKKEEVEFMSILNEKIGKPEEFEINNDGIKNLGIKVWDDGTKSVIAECNDGQFKQIVAIPGDSAKTIEMEYLKPFNRDEIREGSFLIKNGKREDIQEMMVNVEFANIYENYYHPIITFNENLFDFDFDSTECNPPPPESLVISESFWRGKKAENDNYSFHLFWTDGVSKVWYKKISIKEDTVVDYKN